MEIRLYPSGRLVNPFELKEEDIFIEDIANALSLECRFMNHIKIRYTVADHSVWVSELVPEKLVMQGLFHDSAEYILRDISSPFKSYLYWHYKGQEISYKDLEKQVLEKIFNRFKIPWPIDPKVKEIDSYIQIQEGRIYTLGKWNEYSPYKHIAFTPGRNFLNRFKELGGEV